ncbi:MAG: peptidylprolyl isomerase [Acinetobacter sp.]|nr:peptidylprolyl isomerase [Acinetobacter sp.]
MKTSISKLFKATALVSVLGLSSMVFAQDRVVAVVDQGAILQSELDQAVAVFVRQIQAQNGTLPPEVVLKKQALNELILRQAQRNLLQRYGVRISDNELNAALLSVAKRSNINTLEEFQQDLDSKAPNSYARLRNVMAEDLAINRLTQQMVMSRIKISDQDVENFIKSPMGQAMLGSQFHVIHMRIAGENAEQVAAQVKTALAKSNDVNAISTQFSNANVRVQGADLGWNVLANIPTDLAVHANSLQKGDVSEQVKGQDGSIHLVKLLDRKADDAKTIVPQYQTRHILIQKNTVVSEEMAQQKIKALHERVMKGEDFATLAATFSNDTGSARDGGSLGWVEEGQMVPEFEAVIKATPKGYISQPFQTQFGWHFLHVQDVRQQDKTDEYYKNAARQYLGEKQFSAELERWLREVRTGAYVEIKDPSLQ